MLNKVEIVKTGILADIKRGVFRVGEKLSSRNKLCRKYNYSRTTIERAVRELTAAGYLASRQGSSTYVISDKPIDGIRRLYVVCDSEGLNPVNAVQELFFPEINLNIPVTGLRPSEVAVVFNRLCQAGNAVIWIMPGMESIHLMDYLNKAGIPQILVNRKYKHYNYVATDAKSSIKEGLSWLLIEAGRDISFISYMATTDKPYLYERIIAFYECCAELGAHLSPDAIFSREFNDIPSEIAEIARALFVGRKPPKGVFVMHQELVIPLVTAAQTYGFIPGRDYKLLAFDYTGGLENYTGIGMLRQQWKKLYREAAEWLLQNPAQQKHPFRKNIKTELIVL
ncbi:MAG: GntR family transcriptional regulator [Victivallales bacterium]|nr:GntR family transcriptional regulator [Victivallales bacterium]